MNMMLKQYCKLSATMVKNDGLNGIVEFIVNARQEKRINHYW